MNKPEDPLGPSSSSGVGGGPGGTGGSSSTGTGGIGGSGGSGGGGGSGACAGQADNTPCGNPEEPDCDLSRCQAGACVELFAPHLALCGDDTNEECSDPDICDGNGVCTPNHAAQGTPCGDPTADECSDPDICDGNGVCTPNHAAQGTPCGDPTDAECDHPDACDGAGTCDPTYEAAGMACGDGLDDDCTNPDSCDGTGLCDPNHAADGNVCNDCPAGPGSCSTCLSGACLNNCTIEALTTTYVGGNGSTGNMFDMTALANVTIMSFDMNLSMAGSVTCEVYYRPGSYVGFNTTSAGWTFAGTATVTSAGNGIPTPLNLSLSIPMAAGQTYGWYVTTTNSGVNYTNGTAVGALVVQDGNLQIFEGHGGSYPFNLMNAPRIFNGTVHYEVCQ